MLSKIRNLAQRDAFASLSIMGLRGGMLLSKFVLALFITRFIGLEALGVYGLIASGGAIGQIVMRMGVFSTLSREAVGQSLEELTHNLRHYISGCMVLYLLLIPVALLIGWYFDKTLLLLIALLLMLLEHVAQDAFILANNLYKPLLANGLLALQSAIWIYLFSLLAFVFPALRSLEFVLLFWICGGIASLAIVMLITRQWPWRQAFAKPLERTWYMPYVARSWRLYVGEVIATATNYLDRYIITAFMSMELVGVYVLFSQIANAIGGLINAGIIRVYTPRLISAYKDGEINTFNKIYRTCILRSLGSMTGMILVCSALVPFFIRFTNQPLAMEYLPLLWMLLATLLLRGGADLGSTGLYVRHKDSFFLNRILIKLFLSCTVGAASIWLLGIYGTVLTVTVISLTSILYIKIVWNKTSS
jgi:O-antigen/teichoic acid export membrane protein